MPVMRATVACLVGLCVASGSARAGAPDAPAAVAAARVNAPPSIDGTIGEDEWRGVAPFELAYQTQPGDNIQPSERAHRGARRVRPRHALRGDPGIRQRPGRDQRARDAPRRHPQIEVNQRFPLRYAEKRPFFLEGGQFFRSPGALNFVETRQLVDPDWGAKLTTKSGANTFAALAVGDAAPGLAAAPGQSGHGETADVAIGRYQRDILRSSTIGGFVANRRFAGDSNTVAAIDGQLRLPGQTIGYQLARSRTVAQGAATAGDATYVWYDFAGRHWRLS